MIYRSVYQARKSFHFLFELIKSSTRDQQLRLVVKDCIIALVARVFLEVAEIDDDGFVYPEKLRVGKDLFKFADGFARYDLIGTIEVDNGILSIGFEVLDIRDIDHFETELL